MKHARWFSLGSLWLVGAVFGVGCRSGLEGGEGGDASGGHMNGSGGQAGGSAGTGPGGEGGDASGGPGKSIYYLTSTVFGADGDRQVYVGLDDSLDDFKFSTGSAREFAGVASLEAIDRTLYVASGEEPTITRYQITDEFEWIEESSVSFSNYPLSDNANFFYQYRADDHTWYLPFDGNRRILWDPLELKLLGTRDDSSVPLEQEGLMLEAGGNRTGVRYEGSVLQPYFYHDDDWLNFAPASPIAVYDPNTHAETAVLEAPCPGLAVPSVDEEGNVYFSSWDHTPYFALFDAGPPPCVVKVSREREIDVDFTTDLTELTGGRYAMNFRYVRDGWGFADVLHHEELEGDFTGEPDIDVLDQIFEFTHFHLWRIDLKNGRAERYEDAETGSFGWSTARIDGRSLLFVPQDGGAKTKIYELDVDGGAKQLFEVEGDASLGKVR